MFIGLFSFPGSSASIINTSNHTKCISLNNQQCLTLPSHINLHPNEYIEEFHYYPFAVSPNRRKESCNTLNDLSNRVCVPNNREDLNLCVLNIVTRKNESKTLTKHISCKCKCKLDDRKCNSNQIWNNNKCGCKNVKDHQAYQKDYIQNSATSTCENCKYLFTKNCTGKSFFFSEDFKKDLSLNICV